MCKGSSKRKGETMKEFGYIIFMSIAVFAVLPFRIFGIEQYDRALDMTEKFVNWLFGLPPITKP